MLLSELLHSLNVNHIQLPNKDNKNVDAGDYLLLDYGTHTSIVFKTESEVCGCSAIKLTLPGCPQHHEIDMVFIKTKENTLLTQLDWYNKLKPILTAATKNHTSVSELSLSLDQINLICSYYKGYQLNSDNTVRKIK